MVIGIPESCIKNRAITLGAVFVATLLTIHFGIEPVTILFIFEMMCSFDLFLLQSTYLIQCLFRKIITVYISRYIQIRVIIDLIGTTKKVPLMRNSSYVAYL